MTTATPIKHKIVNQSEWTEAATELLKKEKEFTKARDAMSATRRELPWVRVEKDYIFEGPNGPVSLSELFNGKSQLIIYHFMFAPGWDEGCSGCSFVSDHFDAARQHFEHHDVSFAAVSRAPYEEYQAFKKRMDWHFPWVSSSNNSFNYDYGVSFRKEDLEKGPVFYNFKMQKLNGDEQPGLSVFIKDEDGTIYHTYSSYERGLDMLVGAYNFLDLTPLGRNEPEGGMSWMTFHDKYQD